MKRKSIITKLCCLLLVVTLLPIWTGPIITAQASEQAVSTSVISNVQLQDAEEIHSVAVSPVLAPVLTQEVLWDVLGPIPTPLPNSWASLEREEQQVVSLIDEVLWDVLGPAPTSAPSSWANLEREEQQAVSLTQEILWDVLGPPPTSLSSSWADLERAEQLAIMENGLTPALSTDSVMTGLQSDMIFETMLPPALDNPIVYEIVFETVLPPALGSSFVEESVLGNIVHGTELPMLQVCTPLDETEFQSVDDSFALGYEDFLDNYFLFDYYLDHYQLHLYYPLDGVISNTEIMPFSNRVTAIYQGNGNTGGSPPASHWINTPGTLVLRSPGNLTRTGHTFGGWMNNGGRVVPVGYSIWFSAGTSGTATFRAHWVPVAQTMTLQYRSSGHTSGSVPASQTVPSPGTATLRQPGNLARAGHTFGGWRDAWGNVFPGGQHVNIPSGGGTIIFDAVWNRDTVITIQYNGNGHTGGSVPGSQTVNTPGSITLRPQGNLTRTGHTFGGWRDSHGQAFQASQPVSWNSATSGTVMMSAIWIPNSVVTIQYHSSGHTGGSVPANQTVTTPGSIALRPQGNLTRTGHTFGGWRDSNGVVRPGGATVTWPTAVSGTAPMTAVWIPVTNNVITIQYRGNGHTGGSVPASQSLTTPGSITLRPQGNLTRTGHTFGGWRDSAGQIFLAGQSVTWENVTSGNVILDAHWVPTPTTGRVTVVYRGNNHTGGTVPANQTVITPGSVHVSSQGTLTRTGHTFGGWRDTHNGTVIAAGQLVGWSTAVTTTVTLEAIWNPTTTGRVTINYRGNGNTGGTVPASQTVVTPGTINVRAPGTLTRAGHTFGGWRDTHTGQTIASGQLVGWSTAITATVTLDAIWTPIATSGIITVVYRGNGHTGGTVPANQTVVTPGTVNVRNPGTLARTGHTFGGWRDTHNGTIIAAGQLVGWSSPVTTTVTLEANCIPVAATLTVSETTLNKGAAESNHTINVFSNTTWNVPTSNVSWLTIIAPANRTGNGSFRIIATANTGLTARPPGTVTVTAPGAPTQTITVTQQGTGFVITLNPNGGTVNPTTVIRGPLQQVGTLPTPTRAGHTFSGWWTSPTGGTQIQPTTVLSGNTTIFARWNLAHVSLNANGGTVSHTSIFVQPGSQLGSLPTPSRTGHSFVGWFTAQTGGTQVFSTTVINGNITIFARWGVTVTLNPNGGHVSPTRLTRIGGGTMGVVPTPTRIGETLGRRFDGWFTSLSGGARVLQNTITPNNNHTLHARWDEVTLDSTRIRYWWWQENTVPLRTFEFHSSLDTVWRTSTERGRTNWNNNSSSPVYFTVGDTGNRVRVEPRFDRHAYGWLQPVQRSGTALNEFYIVINSRAITSHATNNDYTLGNVIASVMAHELGHAVGLRDGYYGSPLGGGDNRSLMNHDRSRNTVMAPTTFDISSVLMIYDLAGRNGANSFADEGSVWDAFPHMTDSEGVLYGFDYTTDLFVDTELYNSFLLN